MHVRGDRVREKMRERKTLFNRTNIYTNPFPVRLVRKAYHVRTICKVGDLKLK